MKKLCITDRQSTRSRRVASLAAQWQTTSESIIKSSCVTTKARHQLPASLIVSLTSHPARFKTLHLTLECLLAQRMACDKILLWIAHADRDELPRKVRQLEGDRLAIGYCDDLRAYKKIIPTLECYPDAYIVTTDDDAFYKPNWLEGLVSVARKHPTNVVAHIVRRVALERKTFPSSYVRWSYVERDTEPSPLHFPTGVGGVLYPPGAFHQDVFRRDLFEKLAPTNDDIWLYWMWRRNGRKCRYTGAPLLVPAITWPETQSSSLWQVNKTKNDAYVAAMIKKYGFPA